MPDARTITGMAIAGISKKIIFVKKIMFPFYKKVDSMNQQKKVGLTGDQLFADWLFTNQKYFIYLNASIKLIRKDKFSE